MKIVRVERLATYNGSNDFRGAHNKETDNVTEWTGLKEETVVKQYIHTFYKNTTKNMSCHTKMDLLAKSKMFKLMCIVYSSEQSSLIIWPM